jgi:hypothetical protein
MPRPRAININDNAKIVPNCCSSEFINAIILLIHSTAAISANAKLIKPPTLIKKDH